MWKVIFVLLYLIILSIMDIREKQVPLYLLAAGLILAIIIGIGEETKEGLNSGMNLLNIGGKILLGMIPGVFFLGMAWLTGKAGKGDGIVVMIVGILSDYRICMAVFCTSLLLISAFAVCMMALHKIHKKASLPYIPFLAVAYAGYWICEGRIN